MPKSFPIESKLIVLIEVNIYWDITFSQHVMIFFEKTKFDDFL